MEDESRVTDSERLLQYGPKNDFIEWRKNASKCMVCQDHSLQLTTYKILYAVGGERNFHPLPDVLTYSGSEFDDEVAEFSYATATAEDADAERECLFQHHHRLPKSWTVTKSTSRLC